MDQTGKILYPHLSLLRPYLDLAASTLACSKALSVLANVEEHTGLARALGQLADTQEQIAHFLSVEAEAQSTFLVEYSKGVLSMVQACRVSHLISIMSVESLPWLDFHYLDFRTGIYSFGYVCNVKVLIFQ